MARYYSHVSNSTVAGLEANTSGNRYKRIAFVGVGATLVSNAIAARDALDASVRAQLDLANNSGNLGTVIPGNALVRGGTTMDAANVYMNALAFWNADPKIRPNEDITIANSVAASPIDPISVTHALYDNATAAINALVQGTGFYSNLGLDLNKTARSLWHDQALTHFGWDTFTPEIVTEQPVGQGISVSGTPVAGGALTYILSWTFNHPTDSGEAYIFWTIDIQPTGGLGGIPGDDSFTSSGTITSPGTLSVNIPHAAGLQAGNYDATATVQLGYPIGGGLYTYGATHTFPVHNFTISS